MIVVCSHCGNVDHFVYECQKLEAVMPGVIRPQCPVPNCTLSIHRGGFCRIHKPRGKK